MFNSENFIEWTQGRVLSRIFVWGGVDPGKKFLSHAAARKNFVGLLGGSGGMLPWKILKI